MTFLSANRDEIRSQRTWWGCRLTVAFLAFVLPGAGPAAAYIGPSYLQLPDLAGDARKPGFEGWIRAESHYWSDRPELPEIRGIRSTKNDLLFTGPVAPPQGPGMLALSIDKGSSVYEPLMEACRLGHRIAEAVFAESSELARHPQEHGPRPDDIPANYLYRLENIRIACPTADGAPEQAIALHFETIEWLNFGPLDQPRRIPAKAAVLVDAPRKGVSRSFAVTWFAAAVDNHPDQCPRMNSKASEEDYFQFIPAHEADQERSRLGETGVGPDIMSFRGPDRMNVALMPGIVPDPGHVVATADVVRGFDLDGDDGSGAPPPGVRKHRNFVSPDGRKGIDNQLFTVEGCVEGLRRTGFLPMIFNEGRAAGRPTAIVEISGIDDERNDDEVAVTFYFSEDYLRRSPAKVPLPHFTYRVSDSPEFAQDFVRFRGRIVDGVVITDTIESLHMHEVTAIETTILRPRLQIEMLPDGSMKGLVGGYVDWRRRVVWQTFRAADYENTIGFQAPAIYNAMKRAADGLPDPVTGEYTGISAAFEIEGVAAFLPRDREGGRLARARKISTEQD